MKKTQELLLSQDVVIHILSFCTITTVSRCAKLNHEWYRMIHEYSSESSYNTCDAIWKALYYQVTCRKKLHKSELFNYRLHTKLARGIQWILVYSQKQYSMDTVNVSTINRRRTINSESRIYSKFRSRYPIELCERKICWEYVLDQYTPHENNNPRDNIDIGIGVTWFMKSDKVSFTNNSIEANQIVFGCNTGIVHIGTIRALDANPRNEFTIETRDVIGIQVDLLDSTNNVFNLSMFINNRKLLMITGLKAELLYPHVSVYGRQRVTGRRVQNIFPVEYNNAKVLEHRYIEQQ
jgi:hypothetical protein